MPLTRVRLRQSAPVAVTFIALLAWTTYAYLTIRVDGDMVAEVIQVQQWLHAAFWVLSYPGQLHGGIVEYPLIMLAESVSPGNPYGWTLIRILYVPVVAVLLCLSLRRAFPRVNLWPFAVAAALGPAVLHGMVSIKDLYPFSWLLSAVGVYLVYRYLDAPRRDWLLVLGGVLIGLGIYEHPTASLLSIPLVLAAATRWRFTKRQALGLAGGLVVGLLPLFMALKLQPGKHVVFMPAHVGVPDLPGAFGLSTSETSWAKALVPQGWGIQTTDLTTWAFPTWLQLALNIVLAAALVAALVVAVPRGVRAMGGDRGRPLTFLVMLWGGVVVMVTLLITVVPPVFFYGASLGFLVFITAALLPAVWPHRAGIIVTAVVIALMAVTSLGAFLWQPTKFGEAARYKLWGVHQMTDVAHAISDAGVKYIYGDYWETLPIAHASAGTLHPLTVHANRFPLTDPEAANGEVVVAVSDGHVALPAGLGRWPGAQEALDVVTAACTPDATTTERLPNGISAYRCPVTVFGDQ